MSVVYNPESESIAQIERLELSARNIRRTIEHAHNQEDKRVLNRQLKEIEDQSFQLRFRMSMGQTEGLRKIREMRKDKARLLTYLRSKELQGAK